MKVLEIAFFFLASLCVCTVIGDDISAVNATASPVNATTSPSVPRSEFMNTSTSRTAPLQVSVLTIAAVGATNESITNTSTSSLPNATKDTTEATTTKPQVEVATTRTNEGFSPMNSTQASGTQLTQNETLDVFSTKGSSFSSTDSPERNTSASGTSGLPVSSPTESTTSGNPGSIPKSSLAPESDIQYSNIILPVVITLIVITLSVFSLVALYRMCQKKTPETQENGTEQAQSDKEGVKLLSVKTTSPETGSGWISPGADKEAECLVFVEARDIYEVGFSLPSANLSEPTTPPPSGEVSQDRTTGEHSSQGKNKTRQLFTSQQ